MWDRSKGTRTIFTIASIDAIFETASVYTAILPFAALAGWFGKFSIFRW